MGKIPINQKLLNSNRGVAILIALFSIMIMIFVAVEISYETSVEYVVTGSDYHKIKAYQAAKAGVDLSLLRIQVYRNLISNYGQQLKGSQQMVDQIWQFPFTWPPALPKDLTRVDKDAIGEAVTNSFMGATYITTIESEGSKIDINDLGSHSEVLKKNTYNLLKQMIQNRIDQDDDWAKNHRDFRIDELLNNITDWIDEDTDSLNGGDERSKYPDIQSDDIPPNRPFKTLRELQMVDGMTDEIFKTLLPNITVYGTKGINVNQASKNVLKSIHPTVTDEIAQKILDHIHNPDEGPFTSLDDFKNFTGNQINWPEIDKAQVPLYFGSEYNFRITSIGMYSKSTSKIVAITYDFDTVKSKLKEFMDKENQEKNPSQSGNPAPTPTPTPSTQQQQVQVGKPRIVYWQEE